MAPAHNPRSGVRGGRLVQVLTWVLHSPKRAGLVFGAVALAALLLTVMLIAAVTGTGGPTPAEEAQHGQQNSCRATTEGFARAFFASPRDAAWAERVSAWVEPSLAPTVADIDVEEVPQGMPTLADVNEEAGACDAWFTVNPEGTRVRVEASTPAGDGVWYVTAWRPE